MNRLFENNDLILHCISYINDDITTVSCRTLNKHMSLVLNLERTSTKILKYFLLKFNAPVFLEYIGQMSHNSEYSIVCRFQVLRQLMYFIFSKFKLYYLHYEDDYYHKIHFGENYKSFLNVEFCKNDVKTYNKLFDNLASIKNNYKSQVKCVKIGNNPFIILSLSSQVKALVY